MKKNRIRLFKPALSNKEIFEIKKVFSKSWVGYGPKVKSFEKMWSKFFKVKHAVGVNSCTAALHTALAVNKFKKGKKVLVPAISFSASAAVVIYCGLTPVFVDINEDDLNMNFEDLKRKFSNDCVAIIPVHFGGHPCHMEKIIPWAKKKRLTVIEDCAETCGGIYKGKKLGTWGDYGCFSFEEKKIMTTGDGGMIVTNDEKKIKNLRSFSFHGWDKDPLLRHKKSLSKSSGKINHWDYDIKELGFKYNMNDLMASIGISQFKQINWLNNSRTNLIKLYMTQLRNCKNIKFTFPYELRNASYWMLSIRCKKRDQLIKYLRKHGIASSVHLKPLPLLTVYKKYKSKIPNALKTWKELVSLPLFPELKKTEVKYITNIVKKFDQNFKNF